MNVTLDLDLQLTERSRILLDALGKMLPPRVVASAPDEAVQSTAHPRIGERSETAGGIYAGVTRGLDGEPDGHLYLLDDKPDGKLKWTDAAMWAANLGNGARLPTRFESALLYANLQDQLDTENWHWTGTQYSGNDAWGQGFGSGGQISLSKSSEGRCRAVRRLVI